MGPPGAGKGTQGELLARDLDVPRYATGDMLRDARRQGTEMGREAARYMDAGELVPDDVVVGIVAEALDRPEASDGFILDGFPRTLEQAEGLAGILEERGEELDAVVYLEVPEEELVRRLSSRRVCAECGTVTRVEGDGGEGPCPACGGALEQREDDRPSTVRRRLDVYRSRTRPVLDRYRESDVRVEELDGTGGVDEVAARVRERLGR